MGSHVSLQLVGVSAGIAAQAALEWTLSSMRANVSLQFADLVYKTNILGLKIR